MSGISRKFNLKNPFICFSLIGTEPHRTKKNNIQNKSHRQVAIYPGKFLNIRSCVFRNVANRQTNQEVYKNIAFTVQPNKWLCEFVTSGILNIYFLVELWYFHNFPGVLKEKGPLKLHD